MQKWFAVASFANFFLLASASLGSAANETVLYSFQANPDGALPSGGVVFDKDGNLYGATGAGGSPGAGAVFQLTRPTRRGGLWTNTIIHSFQGNSDGDIASSGLISDSAGNLYGVTEFGGTGTCTLGGQVTGCGVDYEMTPPQKRGGTWAESVIYSFKGSSDGDYPFGNLLMDSEGNLYGTTLYGGGSADCSAVGPSCGIVFELSPPTNKGGSWTENVLYVFQGGKDGGYPNGQLVLDQNGALYGTTYLGGNQGCAANGDVGCGTVFALKPGKSGTWTEQILHRFAGGNLDGGNPYAGVIFDNKGRLFGTTLFGGQDSLGTVFRLAPRANPGDEWKETLLHSFDRKSGSYPEASLTIAASGDLYGVACCGGDNQSGSVFHLNPNGWIYSTLHLFHDTPDGAEPAAGLTFDSKGNLVGTTYLGGTGTICDYYGVIGCGTVFR